MSQYYGYNSRRDDSYDHEIGAHRSSAEMTTKQKFSRWVSRQQRQHQLQQQHQQGQISSYNNDTNLAAQSTQSSDGRSDNLLVAENNSDETEIYVVYQKHGYFSILFSIVQTAVVIAMMAQCGIAPLNINPMIGPNPDALSEWGAKNTVLILEDQEYWRLLSPILLHAGLIHLGCNVMVQLDTCAFFEREWGSTNWLIIYLVSAVGSSALSVVAMPDAISVGSSGAVMGLFGGKLAEVVCRFFETEATDQDRIGHQVRKEQCAGVMCSVIVVLLFSFIPYVDWAAHLGGLLAGFCVGMIVFASDLNKAMFSKIFWLLVGVAITALYFGFVFKRMFSGEIEPAEELRDVCRYYQDNFEDYECNCQRNNK